MIEGIKRNVKFYGKKLWLIKAISKHERLKQRRESTNIMALIVQHLSSIIAKTAD